MNALEICGLSKSFSKFRLENIDLTLPSGCILGLIGENGAGKTTLIKLILNLLHEDEGTVKILGQDHTLPLSRKDVGVVLDEGCLPLALTPLELSGVFAGIYDTWDQNDFLSLLEKFAIPPKGKYKTFSKGMKMKTAIAFALSHHPKLLILDEATAGLDPVMRDQFLDILFDFTREPDHSVLISSHIVSDLEKICDYIAFLHKGKLLLFEEKDRLLEEHGLYRCTPEDFQALPKEAVLGKRTSAYGIEALVSRKHCPEGLPLSPISIEDLFIAMVKEEAK